MVAPRTEPGGRRLPLTTEDLTARGDSPEHLHRRVGVSLSRSACPASSSTVVGEQDDLKRRMDEYMGTRTLISQYEERMVKSLSKP